MFKIIIDKYMYIISQIYINMRIKIPPLNF